MAKISRLTHIIFGSLGSTDNYAQFGSLVAGSPLTTKNIATIQALPAWTSGFQAGVYTSNKALLLEDLNGFAYEHSTQIANILQDGISYWDSATVYFVNSVVQYNGGQWYVCIADNSGAGQSGNTPPTGASNAWWEWINPPAVQDDGLTLNAIPKVSAVAAVGISPAKMVPSAISDNGTNVVLSEPLQFPDGSTQAKAAQPITNQNTVTGSRALNTVFQNTLTRPLFVTVTVQLPSGGPGQSATLESDSNASPSTAVAYCASSEGGPGSAYLCMFAVILPGNYYRVSSSTGTLVIWTEWN